MAACLLTAALLSAGEAPQSSISPDLLRLARIKVVMAENLTRLPNYTCTQTIERSHRRASSKRYELLDTLRLEVALVGGKELFAWPGGRFEDREFREMIGGGAFGNGSFALHARAVFLGQAPVYTYRGEVDHEGRRAFLYDYRVARINSGYHLRVGDQEAVVGYDGSFLVDSSTLDLIRLEVQANGIPPSLGLAAAGSVMRYTRVRIGTGDFLLPLSSELVMTHLRGDESRNRTRFSSCRQYAGESVVSFDEPDPAAVPTPAAVEETDLPAGLMLSLHLESEIRYSRSAVGDPLRARLNSDVKRKGKVIIPKGALVLGRLTKLEIRGARESYYIVGLRFDTIEFGNSRAPFRASLESAGVPFGPGAPRVMPVSAPKPPPVAGEAFLLVREPRDTVAAGLRMLWRTLSPADSTAP